MNWYKKAKLIDIKAPTDSTTINSKCMYCGRWATHHSNGQASRADSIWKTHDQLDFEERKEIEKVERNINYVSHGFCKYCLDAMQKIRDKGKDPFTFNPKYISELSLGKRIII